MGGAGLLMAAARRPGAVPPGSSCSSRSSTRPAACESAERRQPVGGGRPPPRPVFDSFEAAIANYASKPPLAAFDPDALDAYVRHGFRADGDHMRLKCDPEHEARTFEQGGRQRTWDVLARSHPVVVVGDGSRRRAVGRSPSSLRPLPAGRFDPRRPLDHFGPITHGVVADRRGWRRRSDVRPR